MTNFGSGSKKIKGFPGGSVVKNLPANTEATGDADLIPGSESHWGGEMATHSSILAGIILWIGEPGRLQSIGSQRVRDH